MDTNGTGRADSDVMVTLYGLVCFATLGSMAVMEQFGDLLGAVVAFASGWFVLRLDPRPDG